ncbi:DUF4837 family protein [Rhodocytophaga aerolata]|uniref:DUF4837 family protein n=2 Tax=Rhodocytophaga aerolata TaxID=455078 RepID=A0ABT8R6U6_9BACT|nr:DUF4837 family protein [Rhodocytophaga aerolata]
MMFKKMNKAPNIISKFFYTILPLLFLFPIACTEKDKKDMASVPSKGNIGEIVVVMDSARWKSKMGDTLRSIFSSEVPGLLTSEPYFKLIYFHPDNLNNFIKTHKNLLFVTSLEDESPSGQRQQSFFSEQTIEAINRDSSFFMFAKQNEFARGQEILHIFGKTDQQIISNLSKNKEKIRQHFNQIELARINKNIFKTENTDLVSKIKQEHGFTMRLPEGFALAKSDTNFVWATFPGKQVNMHVFVAYKPYQSTDAFNHEKIIAWRDTIGYKKMYNQKIKDSYMATQDYVEPTFKQLVFNDKFGIETRGLWKLQNNSRGGPFLSYIFVDDTSNRLYYIEGFILGPGVEKKREFMRQLEAILWTFRPAGAQAAVAKDVQN